MLSSGPFCSGSPPPAGFSTYANAALRRHDHGRAEDLLGEAYARLSPLGNGAPGAMADTGTVLLILGSMDLMQARFDRAAERETAALEHFQRVGVDWGIGEA